MNDKVWNGLWEELHIWNKSWAMTIIKSTFPQSLFYLRITSQYKNTLFHLINWNHAPLIFLQLCPPFLSHFNFLILLSLIFTYLYFQCSFLCSLSALFSLWITSANAKVSFLTRHPVFSQAPKLFSVF